MRHERLDLLERHALLDRSLHANQTDSVLILHQLADSTVRDRPIPEGIVNVRIDPKTGLLARPGQADAIFEYFRVENVPTD